MVDSGMMTDEWQPSPDQAHSSTTVIPDVIGGVGALAAGYYLGKDHDSSSNSGLLHVSHPWNEEDALSDTTARPLSAHSDKSDQNEAITDEKLAKFPSPPASPNQKRSATGVLPAEPSLSMSTVLSEHFEPVSPVAAAPPPLTISTMISEHLEPIYPAAPPPLEMSKIQSAHSEPIAPIPAALEISSIMSEGWEPVSPPKPSLAMSAIQMENSEPVSPTPISLALSSIQSEHSVPVAPVIPIVPLTMSTVISEHSEPISAKDESRDKAPTMMPWSMSPINSEHSEPIFTEDDSRDKSPTMMPLAMSAITSEHSEPIFTEDESRDRTPSVVSWAMSTIISEQSEPVEIMETSSPAPVSVPLTMSSIAIEQSEPVEAEPFTAPAPTRAPPPVPFSFSPIKFVGTEPVESPPARSPKRDRFVFVKNSSSDDRPATPTPGRPETPKSGFMGSVFSWGKNKTPSTPVIAEDSTRQSLSEPCDAETPESQRPFKEISANTDARPNKKKRIETADESSQTALTADQIDDMLRDKSKRQEAILAEDKTSPVVSRAALGGHARGRRSQDSMASMNRIRSKTSESDYFGDAAVTKRPTSAGSNRGSISSTHPPLPSDHKKVIAAAAQRVGSSGGGVGTMGPPPLPASALRAQQGHGPRTPSTQNPLSMKDGTTPRARAEFYPTAGARSHASSVTSFASELDNRFNMQNNGLIMPHGIEPGTDPRMIQAITQTMIGEYLWKYTRKAGRGEQSENRHRRYFWVHPYTRTLYWSDRDPSQNGKSQAKAKSVAIEAVRVVTDDNPMPPGLHRKSLVIITPGRTVKFTAPTGQRHETWFNALSYLLLRTSEGAEDTAAVVEGALTQQDVDEFNPQPSNRSSRRPPPSRSSYNSQATHNTTSSPASISVRQAMNPPQLHQSPSRPSPRPVPSGANGTLTSRFSTLWRPGETGTVFSSRRSRASASQTGSIYTSNDRESEAHDSAEDLRKMFERQDREADRLENVRACCDGMFT